MTELIIVGDEAWLPEEWEAELQRRQRDREVRNARVRHRWATDPEYAERRRAQWRAWYARNRADRPDHMRDLERRHKVRQMTDEQIDRALSRTMRRLTELRDEVLRRGRQVA